MHAAGRHDDNYSTDQDTPLTVPPRPACSPTTPATAADRRRVTGPRTARSTLNADGSFTYTPAAGYIGPDAFTYAAANGAGSARPPSTITVAAAEPPPVAADDTYDTRRTRR